MTDATDIAAGITPGDPRHALRRLRPEFVAGAEACRLSVLAPRADQGLEPALRAALAHRMAMLNKDPALAAQFPVAPGQERVADGTETAEPLASIIRHVDLITLTPTDASAGDIRRLEAAGLSNPQIVALSELIAYVNFQTRILAGLRLLGAA